MTGFTKLFSSLVYSTVWREDMHVKVVWITMLALADRNGRVLASLPGLADAARVTLEQCADALNRLSSPDQWSRTKAFDGKRISDTDGGWQLLNYLKYRELRDVDERRIQTREAVRRHRAKPVSRRKPMKAQAEAEAEAEAEKIKSVSSVTPSVTKPPDPSVLEFPTIGPQKTWSLKASILAEWRTTYPGLDVFAEVSKARAWVKASPERRKTARGMERFLVNWLNRSVNSRPTRVTQRAEPMGRGAQAVDVFERASEAVERVYDNRPSQPATTEGRLAITGRVPPGKT